MTRRHETETLDRNGVPDALIEKAYRDLAGIHHWLGDTGHIVDAIRRDALPVRKIMDVGCATGVVLHDIGRRLNVEAVGVDINPHPAVAAPVSILRADACTDLLPEADVAFSMHLGHHLREHDVVRLIRNVGRSCRRFILLDLVRHAMPLALFRLFVAPFVCPIDARDGQLSVQRSYTPAELRDLTAKALAGSGGTFRHIVAPFYVRQVIDITYPAASRLRPRVEHAPNQCVPTL